MNQMEDAYQKIRDEIFPEGDIEPECDIDMRRMFMLGGLCFFELLSTDTVDVESMWEKSKSLSTEINDFLTMLEDDEA